jgi:4-amino-4-deoxy-L-arabinose transferase-like glycosyltransferase
VKLKANAGWLRQQVISRYKFIVILLLLAILLQCVLSMRMKSITYDEPNHLVAGYSYLKRGDFSLNWPNPPLINVISATPLLFLNPKIQTYDPHHQSGRSFVHDFLYVLNDNADQIIFWARVPSILLSLLLGFFVFRWASELYGIESGLLALLLYAFSPNILAHSRLATTDLGMACFTFLACYYLWKFGSRPSVGNLLLAGFTLGLALISKFSTIFLLLVYLLFPFVQFRNSQQPNSLKFGRWIVYSGLIIGIAALVIAAAYPCYLKPWYRFDETILPTVPKWYPNAKTDKGLWRIISPIRVPGREYALGLLGLIEHSKIGHDAFLWGKISSQGWWYYYLAALAIKTPIALQITLLLILGLSLQQYMKGTGPNLYNDFFLVIPPLFLFTALSFGAVKIGLRHVLFVFPFTFVFTARFFKLALQRRLLSGLAFLLIIWYLVSSIRIHPHYLAYFNEYVGGPANGYKYLVDSNLDWGQDLKGLKKYMEDRGIEKVKLDYMGTIDLDYYGISYEPISDQDLAALREGKFTRGVFAIGATFLQGLYLPGDRDRYKWFRDRTPTTQIGYSIFVYEIDCRQERMHKGTVHFTPPTVQHCLEANLGGQVRFLGYDLDATSAKPDDTLHLTLYWQALTEMDESYTVFTHLLDKDNRIRGQKDDLPVGGALPTNCWIKGEIIADEYDIPIQPDVPTGQYVIEIGMYQLETMQRLLVINQEGQVVGDRVLLKDLTIQ